MSQDFFMDKQTYADIYGEEPWNEEDEKCSVCGKRGCVDEECLDEMCARTNEKLQRLKDKAESYKP